MNRSDVPVHLRLTLESLSANVAYVNGVVVGVEVVLSEACKGLEHFTAQTTHEICNDQTSLEHRHIYIDQITVIHQHYEHSTNVF